MMKEGSFGVEHGPEAAQLSFVFKSRCRGSADMSLENPVCINPFSPDHFKQCPEGLHPPVLVSYIRSLAKCILLNFAREQGRFEGFSI
jgi:hypothetical protein